MILLSNMETEKIKKVADKPICIDDKVKRFGNSLTVIITKIMEWDRDDEVKLTRLDDNHLLVTRKKESKLKVPIKLPQAYSSKLSEFIDDEEREKKVLEPLILSIIPYGYMGVTEGYLQINESGSINNENRNISNVKQVLTDLNRIAKTVGYECYRNEDRTEIQLGFEKRREEDLADILNESKKVTISSINALIMIFNTLLEEENRDTQNIIFECAEDIKQHEKLIDAKNTRVNTIVRDIDILNTPYAAKDNEAIMCSEFIEQINDIFEDICDLILSMLKHEKSVGSDDSNKEFDDFKRLWKLIVEKGKKANKNYVTDELKKLIDAIKNFDLEVVTTKDFESANKFVGEKKAEEWGRGSEVYFINMINDIVKEEKPQLYENAVSKMKEIMIAIQRGLWIGAHIQELVINLYVFDLIKSEGITE